MIILKFTKTVLIVLCLLFTNMVKAQYFKDTTVRAKYFKDTTIFFFRYTDLGEMGVSTADSADYYKILCPPQREASVFDVYEYYKNGAVKFVGKADKRFANLTNGNVRLNGTCISYFQSGKRESIVNYSLYGKDGDEYQYYPDGKPYKTIKNSINNLYHSSVEKLMDCYDINGNTICSNGDGRCIEYDRDFKIILAEGPVKNGLKQGSWKGKFIGSSFTKDTINYVSLYSGGDFKSGLGYDKDGKSYPFKESITWAISRSGPISFVDNFKRYLKLPASYKKSIDTLHISFVVEKDGSFSNPELKEQTSTPEQKKAFEEAMNSYHKWEPSKLYGVPYRTRVVLPLKASKGFVNYRYTQEIWFERKIIM
jgi:antitoxin component YwqK of YwqJK toxin-antitoxin module